MWLMLLACGSFSLLHATRASTFQKQREPESRQGGGERVYNYLLYEGFYSKSLWWLVNLHDSENLCLATFIAQATAITPCECVTKGAAYPEDEVTYKNHTSWYTYATQDPQIGGPLIRGDPKDYALTQYADRTPTSPNYTLHTILPHPQCGSLYTYNIALVNTSEKIPGVKVAWVLTKLDVLFHNSFERLISAQAITGKCQIPFYSVSAGLHLISKPEIEFVYADVQNWLSGCRKLVCPDWDRRVPFESHLRYRETVWDSGYSADLPPGKSRTSGRLAPYAKEVCLDRVKFTKRCFNLALSHCEVKPGTPVYCEAGDLNGLFGFIVTATFPRCFPDETETVNTIFQGLNIAIDWLKDELETRKNEDEDYVIPQWMSDLRRRGGAEWIKDKPSGVLPHPRPVIKPQNQLYSVFSDDAADTIANYYYDDEKLCLATQISPSYFILPCFCVTFRYEVITGEGDKQIYKEEEFYNDFKDPYAGAPEKLDPASFAGRAKKAKPMSVGLMRLRWALGDNTGNDSSQCIEVFQDVDLPSPYKTIDGKKVFLPYCYRLSKVYIEKTCDSHYLDDYAVLETIYPIKYAFTAWIQTSDRSYFKHILDALPQANMMGGECFMVKFNYIPNPDSKTIKFSQVKTEYVRVNLVSYDFCRPLTSSQHWYKADKQDEVWNAHVAVISGDNDKLMEPPNNVSRICITSYQYRFMCDIVTNGAPIFCKSSIARGLVGFISTYHAPACDKKHNKAAYDDVKSKGIVSSVMMRMDRFFDLDISSQTVIRKLEEKSSVGQHTPLILVVATLSVLCFIVKYVHF